MYKYYSLTCALILILTGCQNQSASTPPQVSTMLGYQKMTYMNKAMGFAFDYPEQAIGIPNCPPMALHTAEEGQNKVYLRYDTSVNNNAAGRCALGDSQRSMVFAAAHVTTTTEIEQVIRDFSQDPDCRGVTLEPLGDPSSNVFNVFIDNIDMTNEKACDKFLNYVTQYDRTKQRMWIYPGKGSGPLLIQEPLEGDTEITKSFRFP